MSKRSKSKSADAAPNAPTVPAVVEPEVIEPAEIPNYLRGPIKTDEPVQLAELAKAQLDTVKPTVKSNQPVLEGLTEEQRAAVLDGADAIFALADFRRRNFNLWMMVARGVAALCSLADQPSMPRNARKDLLEKNGYGTIDAGTVSKLLHMIKYETEIHAWRSTLAENQRENWNSPNSISNRCPAVRKAIDEANKNNPRRKRRESNKQASNKNLTIDSALDYITNYLCSMEDDDFRASVIERLVKLTSQFSANF
jgi:hypothetical protein